MNMSKNLRMEFPRPDFERKDWMSLNGEWEFSFDKDVFDKKIMVPFCYQSKMSGIGVEEEHFVVWYKKSFEIQPEKLGNQKLLLHFGAVDYKADIWLNGNYVGVHQGGHTSFSFDITDQVKNAENILVVKAADYNESDKPRGKQTWTGEKFGCWYTPTTGIWQSVWLEYAGETYCKRIKITPDINTLSAQCEVFLSSKEVTEVLLEASLKELSFGKIRINAKNGYGKAIFAFPDYDLRRDELFWSPENPNLVDVKVSVINEKKNDEVSTYFGMRCVESQNGRMLLNQNFYYQRLVLDQGYWPESLLTPPSDEAIKKDLTLAKEMGFNGVRKHQKIEDPRFYYWADKLGMLVWGELPSAYEFNDNAITNSSRELVEFIERDYNHPCIVAWVPINESWGVRNVLSNKQQQDYCRMLTYLIKSYDPMRMVSANDGWEQVADTDICAIHDYALFQSTAHKYDSMDKLMKEGAESRVLFAKDNQYQGQPVIMTEYGGIAFDQDGGWGYYDNVKSEKEFIERLEPITTFLIKSGKFTGFCYTQLTDVMQEVNGLLTEYRTPKVSVEQMAEIFGQRVY